MYLPRDFVEADDEVILSLVRLAGFGHLVCSTGGGLASTPLPFVVDDSIGSVRAHVARPNAIWRSAPCDALLIVPVSDAYVSPTWYPSKGVHGKVVPTWNYEVVHLHGRLEAHDDPAWVRRQIDDLTDLNEASMPSPWSSGDAPADYITALAKGIVGVELHVDRVAAKRKLSQNKSDDDRTGVIDGFRSQNRAHRQVADSMASHPQPSPRAH